MRQKGKGSARAGLEVMSNDLEEIGDSEGLDEVVGGAEFQAFSDVLRCDQT